MSESVTGVAEDMTLNPLFSCHTSVAAPRPAENLPADTAGCDVPGLRTAAASSEGFSILGWSPKREVPPLFCDFFSGLLILKLKIISGETDGTKLPTKKK